MKPTPRPGALPVPVPWIEPAEGAGMPDPIAVGFCSVTTLSETDRETTGWGTVALLREDSVESSSISVTSTIAWGVWVIFIVGTDAGSSGSTIVAVQTMKSASSTSPMWKRKLMPQGSSSITVSLTSSPTLRSSSSSSSSSVAAASASGSDGGGEAEASRGRASSAKGKRIMMLRHAEAL